MIQMLSPVLINKLVMNKYMYGIITHTNAIIKHIRIFSKKSVKKLI